jgi:hypothetical protein
MHLLELARGVFDAEKHVDPVEERYKAEAELTKPLQQPKTAEPPATVERIVAGADATLQIVRFADCQSTTAGESKSQTPLCKTLLKCGSPRLPDCGAVFHTATAGA